MVRKLSDEQLQMIVEVGRPDAEQELRRRRRARKQREDDRRRQRSQAQHVRGLSTKLLRQLADTQFQKSGGGDLNTKWADAKFSRSPFETKSDLAAAAKQELAKRRREASRNPGFLEVLLGKPKVRADGGVRQRRPVAKVFGVPLSKEVLTVLALLAIVLIARSK